MVAEITGVVFTIVVCCTNSLDIKRINWNTEEIVFGVNNSRPFNIYVDDFIYPLRPVGNSPWIEIKRVLQIDEIYSKLKELIHESKVLSYMARGR